ncbi:hypothetical protein DPEC_G00149930 [Dallia pectoralis]|uniref:Uncharacterized protein n=1 Tax=Dallia pectoralis TaxID=75939 RepID=A0ACC2GJA7_DALPE|nr:hypothetical protein DPEC_G00149930 [Dallia pectoralis]
MVYKEGGKEGKPERAFTHTKANYIKSPEDNKEKMKAVCFSLLFLLLVCSFGEALKCNRCVGSGCNNTVENCRSDHDACITAIFLPPSPSSFFSRCIKRSDCFLLAGTPGINAYCCDTDLCN